MIIFEAVDIDFILSVILNWSLLTLNVELSQHQAFGQRGVRVSFGHPIADFGHPNIHIFCVWDEKELDTQFTPIKSPNVYFWTPNSKILAKALHNTFGFKFLQPSYQTWQSCTLGEYYF